MRAFWLLCMFHCVIYSINAQENNPFDYLSDEKKVEIIGYELAFFQSNNDSLLLGKANAYKQAGKYSEALDVLQRLKSIDTNYEKALLYYLNGEIENSYNQLLRINLVNDTIENTSYHLLYVLLLIKKDEYELAKEYLLNNYNFRLKAEQILEIIPSKIKSRNVERAYNLSLVLPGLGQTYAGYPGRGTISGLMQAGSAGFTYYSLVNQYYFSGVLTGAALFYTFYLGGARYAGKLAIEKNEQIQDQVITSLKNAIKKANPNGLAF